MNVCDVENGLKDFGVDVDDDGGCGGVDDGYDEWSVDMNV